MIHYLPDPVVARVQDLEGGRVSFLIRDAGHRDAFEALLQKAIKGGYAVEISLVHYEGTPDMAAQARARKARKAQP